ncbi:MAG TPA: DUF6455 family protein [Dongiaceae bacterium]|nr:DUF6455 family protein [Dongiaceae bacterium]
MSPSLFQLTLAIFMVVVGGSLVVWFWRYLAAGSERRMTQMLTRAGVTPEVIKRSDVEAIIKDVRSRCRACSSEDLCERWLAGKVEGENDFCPNAQIFRSLARTPGPIAP